MYYIPRSFILHGTVTEHSDFFVDECSHKILHVILVIKESDSVYIQSIYKWLHIFYNSKIYTCIVFMLRISILVIETFFFGQVKLKFELFLLRKEK
jgi:hypothetical protein